MILLDKNIQIQLENLLEKMIHMERMVPYGKAKKKILEN